MLGAESISGGIAGVDWSESRPTESWRGVAGIGREKEKIPSGTIHLATAVIRKADVFLTFDDKLVALNTHPEIEGLSICKPFVSQPSLI